MQERSGDISENITRGVSAAIREYDVDVSGEQSEVARLGVHFRPPIRRGSDEAAPVRELMALNRE